MRTLPLLVLLLTTAAASADFRATPHPFAEEKVGPVSVHLECHPSTDRFATIDILGTFEHDRDDRPFSLDVHIKFEGDPKVYDRSEQYPDGTLWQMGELYYVWMGHSKNHPRISMEAHLRFVGQWIYSEERKLDAASYSGSHPSFSICRSLETKDSESSLGERGERDPEAPVGDPMTPKEAAAEVRRQAATPAAAPAPAAPAPAPRAAVPAPRPHQAKPATPAPAFDPADTTDYKTGVQIPRESPPPRAPTKKLVEPPRPRPEHHIVEGPLVPGPYGLMWRMTAYGWQPAQ